MNCPKCNEDIMSMSVHFCNPIKNKPKKVVEFRESKYDDFGERWIYFTEVRIDGGKWHDAYDTYGTEDQQLIKKQLNV